MFTYSKSTFRGHYSDQATGWMTVKLCFDSRQEQACFGLWELYGVVGTVSLHFVVTTVTRLQVGWRWNCVSIPGRSKRVLGFENYTGLYSVGTGIWSWTLTSVLLSLSLN